MRKIVEAIKKFRLIDKNQHIVLGLSGGPDSVCLFNVLMDLAEDMNLNIHPVHVNHKFRPRAAERDQKYVEELCKARGVECRSFIYDCNAIAEAEGISSEEAGRKARYEAFAKVAGGICESGVARDMVKIAVAQNADDQAETILFRILRGTGIHGLSGISYERTDEHGFSIVRPLLDVTKAEIMGYCEAHGLKPCMDHTNKEPIYTRNKIRLELIPYLEKGYNPNIRETLIRMGKTAASDSEYIEEQALAAYDSMVKNESEHSILLDGEALTMCHKAIRRRVISISLGKLGLHDDVSYAHFEELEKILQSDSPSARTDLPKGYYAVRNYGDLKICRDAGGAATAASIKTAILDKNEALLRSEALKLRTEGENGRAGRQLALFDYEKMREALGDGFESRVVLGTREAGDYLPLGDGRRKKIQDYMVDRKIPKDERDEVQMVKTGHQVLWVLPRNDKGRFCGIYKVDETTKKVFCIEIPCNL